MRDLRARQQRALKLLPRDAAAPGLRRMLAREFALLSRLAHPGIAAVYDLEVVESVEGSLPMPGRFEGSLFFTEEHVPGPDLSVLAEEPAPERYRRIVRVALHITEALQYLHARGLCHRDIKPANVLLRDEGRSDSDAPDRVVLIDLGLAAVTHGSDAAVRALRAAAGQLPPSASETGVAGSLAYMAPEALYGEGGARADLYSLGATLFELCATVPPFGGASRASGEPPAAGGLQRLVHAILEEAPPQLVSTLPDVPADLAAIVHKLLRKRPEDRYSGAGALHDDLLRAAGDYWQGAGVGAASGKELAVEDGGPVAAPRVHAELVGRSEVLSLLQETFREGAGVGPPVAVVRGSPGVGKSRLLRELKNWAQLTTAADLGRALIHAEGSLSEVTEGLRRAVAAGAADVSWVDGLLSDTGDDGQHVGDEHRGDRGLRGLASFLLGVAIRAPFFVRISGDDPAASYDLATALARALSLVPESGEARHPFLIAFEVTDDAQPPEEVSLLASTGTLVDVPLAPLSRTEASRLAALVLRRQPTPKEEAALWQSTAGNPLLVVEHARDPERELPRTVEDLVRRRFETLPPVARELLIALAVWDAPADPARLHELMGSSAEESDEAVSALVGRGWCEVVAVEVVWG